MAYRDDPVSHQMNMKYIQTAMDAPMLEKEHELDLARRWLDKKDEKALHELIASYSRLVVAIAAKFKNYGLPMGDLIQEGHIGLLEAANRFDPDRDLRFSTYASWWVRAAIQDFVLKNWSIVRTGSTASQKSLFFNLRRLRAQIEDGAPQDFLSDENVGTIAEELNVSEKDVRMMEGRMSGSDHSLNATITQDNNADEWINFMEDERPNPETIVVDMQDAEQKRKWLCNALGQLNERERTIIKQRQLTDHVKTLEDLGQEFGVSKERIRQIEQRAMEKLKENVLSQA